MTHRLIHADVFAGLVEAAVQPVMEMAEALPVPALRQHALEGI